MKRKTRSARREEFKVRGEELLKRVKELIKEGNVRRVTISDKKRKRGPEFSFNSRGGRGSYSSSISRGRSSRSSFDRVYGNG